MRNHAIDGLRAIAMSMVIAQHCGLLPFGWTGVWLFFVISGYVITQGFISGAYRKSSIGASYVGFMGRRAIRILPVYFLYVCTCLVAALAIDDTAVLADLPYLMSFTYNWHMIFGFWPGFGNFAPLGHLWTLSIEQQFYVVFGIFALLLPVRVQTIVSFLVIGAGPLVRWAWSTSLDASLAGDPGRHAFSVYAATQCHADAFLMGSLIARLEPQLRARAQAVTRGSCVALLAAGAYALVYIQINRLLGATGKGALRNVFSGVLYGELREVFVYFAIDAVAVVLLVHVLLNRVGTNWLAYPHIAWVGRVSYGGYLLHAIVLWAVQSWVTRASFKSLPVFERVQVFLACWVVTVALASISYTWFEQPLARFWSARSKAALARRATSPISAPEPQPRHVRAGFGP